MRAVEILLAHNPASLPGAAAAEFFGIVGIVVTPGMDHQAAAFEVGGLQPRSQHRKGRSAVGTHVKRGQVAEVTAAVRAFVPSGSGGVIVSAGAKPRHHLTVLRLGAAIRIFVHMESVQPG